MKQVFILNPAAGKGAPALQLREQIDAVFTGRDVEICVTDAPGEATSLVRSRAMQGNPVRFYACGGDGTLREVVAGVQGCQNAEVACVPCGSANDFVRIFRGAGSFLDLSAQAAGLAVPLDGIDCGGKLAIGLCALGMDAAVAYKMIRYKHLPLVSGPMAYNLAIVDCFLHRIGCDLEVTMELEDGSEQVETGRFFFALAANGQYYGGGYRGAPMASPTDGLLDFVLVRAMRRVRIPGFLKKYKAGEHLSLPVCLHARGRRMRVRAAQPAVATADGECFVTREAAFSVMPGAVRFVVPRGAVLPEIVCAGQPAACL